MRARGLGRVSSCAAVWGLVALAGGCGGGGGGGGSAIPANALTVKSDGGDFTTIQAAVDAASPGDTIAVYPGDYVETASDRWVLDGLPGEEGPYQFGLFIGHDKGGITIQGVDASGSPVRDWAETQAFVTTNATNGFGPSGVFVEGDGVTIAGLSIGTNLSGQNKTIEVTGDDFRLLDCDVNDLGGALYFGDWRFDEATDTSHIQRYLVEGNRFGDTVTIALTNGAGYSGDVGGRQILSNAFENSAPWPSISFNGSGTGVPWFVYSVGGARIRSNSFVNTFVYDPSSPGDLDTEGHIRARGTYDDAQFDWTDWWNENSFNHAYVVGPLPPMTLRTYAYPNAWGTFENVRRIGAVLEGEQAHQQAGDLLLAK